MTVSSAREIIERKKRQAAEELAAAEADALASGKEKFDLAKLEGLLRVATSDERHRAAYYITHSDVRTLAEYVEKLRENEPYEDSN